MPKKNTASSWIKIREAKLTDVWKISKIERDSFEKPWGIDAFIYEFFKKHSRLWVIEYNSELVGYSVVWIIKDEAYIANIAVAPSFRRKGLASFLIRHIMNEAQNLGCSSIVLEVKRSNIAAINLYKKMGFEIVGIREKMYSDGEDGLIMEKLL